MRPIGCSCSRFAWMLAILVILICIVSRVSADCECGYSIGSPESTNYTVFTEVLESDFTMLDSISGNTDWVPQEWKVKKSESRGPYGRHTLLKNVVSNPLKDKNNKASSLGKNGGEAGLELWVRKLEDKKQDYISVAEVDTYRTDMFHGTFRAAIQVTDIKGTCGAFFWYLNDTQEIDMEFLSSQMNETAFPVNLVLHSTLSFQNGGDASSTPSYKVVNLPFQPSNGIHEYRFDWIPGSVRFYADGELLAVMDDPRYIPSVPGKIVLSHWSNGQELWSGGPPEEDAKMRVEYVKAYFNTTTQGRIQGYQERCVDPKATNSICPIPEQRNIPLSRNSYFFSQDPTGNKTNGQIIYEVTSAAWVNTNRLGHWIWLITTTAVVFNLF